MELYDSSHATAGGPLKSSLKGGTLPDSQLLALSQRLQKLAPQFGWPALTLLTLAPHSSLGLGWVSSIRSFLVFGIPIILSGLVLRLWARGYNRAEGFVIDGPYRYIRNPVEVGAVLGYLGCSLILGLPVWFILSLLGISVLYLSVVGLSVDQSLALKFGRPFLRYCRRVKRWIPSRLPGTNRTDRNFSLAHAITHERESLVWIVVFLGIFALRSRLVAWVDPF